MVTFVGYVPFQEGANSHRGSRRKPQNISRPATGGETKAE